MPDDESNTITSTQINTIQIIVRPVDPNNNPGLPLSYETPPWTMGEDMILDVDPLTSLHDLKGIIEIYKQHMETEIGSTKFISRHRMQLRVNGKAVTASREPWTIRRLGIYDGTVIQVTDRKLDTIILLFFSILRWKVEPTISGDWYWHDYDYYAEQLLERVLDIIRSSNRIPCMLSISELSDVLGTLPPIFRINLKAFLRRYPEKVHIYCDYSGFQSVYWVQEATHSRMVPTFGEFPIDIGFAPRFKAPDFNWDEYRDIDDMYKEGTIDDPIDVSNEFEDDEEDGMIAAEVSALLEEMIITIIEKEDGDSSQQDENSSHRDDVETLVAIEAVETSSSIAKEYDDG